MSARLIRAVGVTRARDLSYTARTFTGAEALAWGMATQCVPADDLDAAVDELATQIAANDTASIAAYKDLYRAQQERGLGDGLSYEYTTMYDMGDATDRLGSFGS